MLFTRIHCIILGLLIFVSSSSGLLAKTYEIKLTLDVKKKYFSKSLEKPIKITVHNTTPENFHFYSNAPSNPHDTKASEGQINLELRYQGKAVPIRNVFRGRRILTPRNPQKLGFDKLTSSGALKPEGKYVAKWNLQRYYKLNATGKYRIRATFERKRRQIKVRRQVEEEELRELGVEDINKWRKEHHPIKFKGKSDWHEFRIVKNTRRSEQIEKIKRKLDSDKPSAVASALEKLDKHPEYHFRQEELNKKLFMLLNSDNYEIRKLAYMYLFRARDSKNLDYFETHKDRIFDKYESTVDAQKFEKMILNSVNSEDFELRLTTARALDEDPNCHYLERRELYQKIPHKKWFHREDSEKIRMLLVGWLDGLTIRDKKEICRFLKEIVHNQNVAARVRKRALDALIRKNRFEGYRAGLKISNDDSTLVYTNGAAKKVKTTLGAWAKERCKAIIEANSYRAPKLKKIRKEVLGEE